jgi:4-hydroxythreonine-4-phosphate dehydrogenase
LTPSERVPLLVLTQGDPAGIGPEILLALLARWSADRARCAEEAPGFRPLAVIEDSALRGLRERFPERFPRPLLGAVPEPLEPEPSQTGPSQTGPSPRLPWDRLRPLDRLPEREELDRLFEAGEIPVIDPVGERRQVEPGVSGDADADGALAALDVGIEAVTSGVADALVTAPVSKASIARRRPGFTGHTDYLAERAGLGRYGRDYLMAFLAPDLQVALLSTHLPLREALDRVTGENLSEALDCLHRHAGGRIAVAGFDPHAGEGGLLGSEDEREVAPVVAAARERGLDVVGPESADSVFARARRGELDWVLALYHDQGLIAVKTAAFGRATNWTLGLPYLRTSVDHGTAFELAGRGLADVGPLEAVVATTLRLLAGELPRQAHH